MPAERALAEEIHRLRKGYPEAFGGLYVRMFAELYPEEVVGMVLVDASHPDMWARAPAELRRSASRRTRGSLTSGRDGC